MPWTKFRPISYVTATPLPATPVDGAEIYYRAEPANGVVWHLRYNATSGSTYKWEYVGGALPYKNDWTQRLVSTTTGTWQALTSLAITAPLAGEYIVDGRGRCYTNFGSNANVEVGMGFRTGSGSPTNPSYSTQNTQQFLDVVNRDRLTVSANTAIEMVVAQLSGSTRNVYREAAYMSLMPVRVSL